MLNNHRGKLALSPIMDLGTLDYQSKLLGEADVERLSVTDQAGGGTSTSRSQQRERLAPARFLPKHESVRSQMAPPAATVRRPGCTPT